MKPLKLLSDKESSQMITELAALGCVVYSPGIVTHSGLEIDRYMDGRKVFGNREARSVVEKPILRSIDGDIETIVTIGYDGLMMGSIIAHARNIDLVAVRKEDKNYGMKNTVEGHYKKGSKAIMVDGTLSSGKTLVSTQKKIEKYTDLDMNGSLVLLNRSGQFGSWMKTVTEIKGDIKYFMDHRDLYSLPMRLLTKSSPAL